MSHLSYYESFICVGYVGEQGVGFVYVLVKVQVSQASMKEHLLLLEGRL